jgi:hypothetical protein
VDVLVPELGRGLGELGAQRRRVQLPVTTPPDEALDASQRLHRRRTEIKEHAQASVGGIHMPLSP